MEENKNQQNSRKPYEKPMLRKIELAAEEVLAAGCKTAVSSGPMPPTCAFVSCAGLGS